MAIFFTAIATIVFCVCSEMLVKVCLILMSGNRLLLAFGMICANSNVVYTQSIFCWYDNRLDC